VQWGAGGRKITLSAALWIVVVLNAPAHAQRTDIVTLANGDRITGEVSSRRFVGSLRSEPNQILVVAEATGPVGFSYTRSSDIAQLNANANTVYRSPSSEARLTGSATATLTTDDDERDDRVEDIFLSVNVFDTFDSDPPTADAQKNDVGVVLSFGLSF
jgi:hypothetical protein